MALYRSFGGNKYTANKPRISGSAISGYSYTWVDCIKLDTTIFLYKEDSTVAVRPFRQALSSGVSGDTPTFYVRLNGTQIHSIFPVNWETTDNPQNDWITITLPDHTDNSSLQFYMERAVGGDLIYGCEFKIW